MLIWTSAGTTRGEDTVQNQRMFIYLFYSFLACTKYAQAFPAQ